MYNIPENPVTIPILASPPKSKNKKKPPERDRFSELKVRWIGAATSTVDATQTLRSLGFKGFGVLGIRD